MPITEKLCTGPCALVLPLDAFGPHPLGRGGRRSRCLICESVLSKQARRERGLKAPRWPNVVMDVDTGRFRALKSFEERFWEKVQVCMHGRDCRTCCWPWMARLTDGGYGMFGWREPGDVKTKNLIAHRIAFRLTFDYWPKPIGRHSCDFRACCQPYHVLEGTHAQNSHDMTERNRQAKGQKIHRAFLTEEKVLAIRALEGICDYKTISSQFDISKCYVFKIWRRTVWKHL